MNSLPLSWSITNTGNQLSHSVNKWNINWLALHELKSSSLPIPYSREFNKSELLIRGCNTHISNNLAKIGFSKIHFGMEAILDTTRDYPNKKSLIELEKRASKIGFVEKLEFNHSNYCKLEQFKRKSIHGSKPQLEKLFQTEFRSNNVLFVFKGHSGEWLGAMLLSENSPKKLQAELLLRKNDSPAGVMETLVKEAFYYAKKNNFSDFSLGEVPFIFDKNSNSYNEITLNLIGKIFQFAYNHKGLYNFKNKFNPIWEPLFICSSKKITYKHLFFIFVHSKFVNVVFDKIWSIFKKSLSFTNNKGQKFIPNKLDFNKT